MTCATSAWSWSTWAASTTCPPSWPSFGPEPGRRLGVLVDHLVDGSKESRIAAQVCSPHVLIVGHPYIDVWAAVKPSAVGIPRWPRRAARPAVEGRRAGGPGLAGKHRRRLAAHPGARCASFTDLEPAFLGRVEELIDFVTAPGSA